MAVMNWIDTVETLSPAALTVRAQMLSPNDDGLLLWDAFFPREDVNGIELDDVTTIDYRPAADRREWNASGRLIPNRIPTRRKVTIVPIEARDMIGEKEMQTLQQGTGGNADIIRQLIGVDLNSRVDKLVMADYRRLELDAFQAWTAGKITQRNPETGATFDASFGFDTARLNTAVTAWNDGGVNAYDLLQAWIVAAMLKVGPIKGAMLRTATLNAILADAPNLQNSVKMTRSELARRVSDDAGIAFEFFINDRTVEAFTDGGTATTTTNVWPAQKIAAVPANGLVGRTAFAPVIRAMDLAAQVGMDAGIDVRGATVYYDEANSGKALMIEAQMNCVPIPDENKVYITDTGV